MSPDRAAIVFAGAVQATVLRFVLLEVTVGLCADEGNSDPFGSLPASVHGTESKNSDPQIRMPQTPS